MAVLRRIRQGYRAASAVCLIASAVAFYSSSQFAALKLAFNYWDPLAITEYRLGQLTDEDFVREINAAVDEGDIGEAQDLLAFALDHGHTIPDDLEKKTQESYFGTAYRYSTDFANGFISGDINSAPSFAGSVFSDLTAYGDVRDLAAEGQKYIAGEDYSPIILGLAVFGTATSVSSYSSWVATMTSGGLAAPAAASATNLDSTVSVFKSAFKLNKISQPLRKQLSLFGNKLVKLDALKEEMPRIAKLNRVPSFGDLKTLTARLDLKKIARGDFSDARKTISEVSPIDTVEANKVIRKIVNPDAIVESRKLFEGTSNIITSGGLMTAFATVKYADDINDISKISKISSRFKKTTKVVLRMLGKGAFQLGKLVYWMIPVLFATFCWVLWAAWLLFSLTRGTTRLFVRKAGKA